MTRLKNNGRGKWNRDPARVQAKIRQVIKKEGYESLNVAQLAKKLSLGKEKIIHNLGLMGIDLKKEQKAARIEAVRQIIDESHRAMICAVDIMARVKWLDSQSQMAKIIAKAVGIDDTIPRIRDHYYFAEVDAILEEHGKLDTLKQVFYLLYLAGVDYNKGTNERVMKRYEASRNINIRDYLRRRPKTAKTIHKSKGAKQ